MDNAMLNAFARHIKENLEKQCLPVQEELMHNHPPVKHLVKGCDYCSARGNWFVDTFSKPCTEG